MSCTFCGRELNNWNEMVMIAHRQPACADGEACRERRNEALAEERKRAGMDPGPATEANGDATR